MILPAAVASLVAMTPAARLTLGGRPKVGITKFPFKVGRESRISDPPKSPFIELRLGVSPQLNDVYLLERPSADFIHISREHFAIESVEGQFFVVDRGSECGTIVGGQHIGGKRTGGRTELRAGDVIVVGTEISEYAFRFELATAPDAS